MSWITESYGREYDFPEQSSTSRVSYMLASNPRSGSTFLSALLWKCGCLGSPMEYLTLTNGWAEQGIKNMGATAYWLSILRRRTSPNGVFGFKMFTKNYQDILNVAPELIPMISSDYVIRLRRVDKLGQAISYFKAVRSRAWFHDDRAQQAVVYDYQEIRRFLDIAISQEAEWDKILGWTRAKTLEISYEDVVKNPPAVICAVANYMDIELNAEAELASIVVPNVQSDSISLEWRERFLADEDQDTREKLHS